MTSQLGRGNYLTQRLISDTIFCSYIGLKNDIFSLPHRTFGIHYLFGGYCQHLKTQETPLRNCSGNDVAQLQRPDTAAEV